MNHPPTPGDWRVQREGLKKGCKYCKRLKHLVILSLTIPFLLFHHLPSVNSWPRCDLGFSLKSKGNYKLPWNKCCLQNFWNICLNDKLQDENNKHLIKVEKRERENHFWLENDNIREAFFPICVLIPRMLLNSMRESKVNKIWLHIA